MRKHHDDSKTNNSHDGKIKRLNKRILDLEGQLDVLNCKLLYREEKVQDLGSKVSVQKLVIKQKQQQLEKVTEERDLAIQSLQRDLEAAEATMKALKESIAAKDSKLMQQENDLKTRISDNDTMLEFIEKHLRTLEGPQSTERLQIAKEAAKDSNALKRTHTNDDQKSSSVHNHDSENRKKRMRKCKNEWAETMANRWFKWKDMEERGTKSTCGYYRNNVLHLLDHYNITNTKDALALSRDDIKKYVAAERPTTIPTRYASPYKAFRDWLRKTNP